MKGVSPVIATVLLLFIAIGMVGTASVFVEDVIGQIQGGLEEEVNQSQIEDSTQITVIDSSECEIRNTGGIVIDGNNWFIDGEKVGGPSELKPEETGEIDDSDCTSGILEHPQGASAVIG